MPTLDNSQSTNSINPVANASFIRLKQCHALNWIKACRFGRRRHIPQNTQHDSAVRSTRPISFLNLYGSKIKSSNEISVSVGGQNARSLRSTGFCYFFPVALDLFFQSELLDHTLSIMHPMLPCLSVCPTCTQWMRDHLRKLDQTAAKTIKDQVITSCLALIASEPISCCGNCLFGLVANPFSIDRQDP